MHHLSLICFIMLLFYITFNSMFITFTLLCVSVISTVLVLTSISLYFCSSNLNNNVLLNITCTTSRKVISGASWYLLMWFISERRKRKVKCFCRLVQAHLSVHARDLRWFQGHSCLLSCLEELS